MPAAVRGALEAPQPRVDLFLGECSVTAAHPRRPRPASSPLHLLPLTLRRSARGIGRGLPSRLPGSPGSRRSMTSLHDSRAVPPSPRDIVARCPHRRHLRFVQRDMSLKGEGESGRDRSASAAPGRPVPPGVIRRVAGALYWRHPAHPSGGASWTPRRDSGPIPCAAGRAVSGTPRGSGQRCAKPCSPPADFIYPLFIVHGEHVRDSIPSMPGICQLSVDQAVGEAGRAAAAGVPAVLLFGIPASKDPIGEENYDDDGIIQRAVRALKDAPARSPRGHRRLPVRVHRSRPLRRAEPREPDAPARLRVERRDPRRPRPRLDQPRPAPAPTSSRRAA